MCIRDRYERLRVAFRWIVIGALGLAAFGCATSNPPAPFAAASPDYNYIVGPGDTVNIVVWRNPELSMSVPVRPDGKITAPPVSYTHLDVYKRQGRVLPNRLA